MIRTPGEGSRRPGLAAVGLGLLALFSIQFDNFLGSDSLSAIGLSSSAVLVAAIGTMALLVSGNVDLSIGSQYALISVVTATVVRDSGDAWLGVAAALSLGLSLGLINGWLVRVLNISPLIVTLAMLAIYRGLAFVVGGGVSVFDLSDSFTSIGRAHLLGVPLQVVLAGLAFAIGAWVLVATVTGLRLFAIGGDRASAALMGVPVNRLVVGAFAANGALIGLVALLGTAKLGSGSPLVGVGFELQVLIAVILGGVAFTGGRGHPLGVFVGVLTLGVLNAGLIFAGLADWYQQIARGSLLLLALAADQLLVGREQRRVRQRRSGLPSPPHLGAATPFNPKATQRSDVVLEARDLSVRFSGVDALDAVSLRVGVGEVICLVGDNGAGKTTLVKAICGAVPLASGTLTIGGQKIAPQPALARRAGIETVFQEFALCPNLGVADNLALGLEPRRRIARIITVRDVAAADRMARARLDGLGVVLDDLRRPVRLLSGGERQIVQILRVMRDDVRLVILDEPTAALGLGQVAEVLRLVRAIARAGHPVLLITHDVEEVFDVADRVVVLQRGRVVFDGPVASVSRLELLRLMSGRSSSEASRILAAVDTERTRIERDLHDGAQQRLVAIALWCDVLEAELADVPSVRAREVIERMSRELDGAIADLRELTSGGVPAPLIEQGLDAALAALAERTPGTVVINGSAGGGLPPSVAAAGYFAAAEGLTNALRHSRAREVELRVLRGSDRLRIEVRDDGIGGAQLDKGSGLRGLRERLAEHHGGLSLESPPGGGTVLVVELPTPES
ncbi:MAG: ATP-binding cassette domain-containing protein [Actinomycetota bacterium]|nr:ATP-binding cassette domain-containing protein [Actinomycetota bacterium]